MAALLDRLRRLVDSGANQDEIITRLSDILRSCDIRIRLDRVDAAAPDPGASAPGPSERPTAGSSAGGPAAPARPAPPAASPEQSAELDPPSPRPEHAEARPEPRDAEPAAPAEPGPAGPDPAVSPDSAGGPAGPTAEQKRRNRKKKNRRARQVLVVPTSRQADGSHCLDFGGLEPFGGRAAADAPREAADAEIGRAVLCVGRRSHQSRPLSFECNGLVLDARRWRVLAAPPPAFNARFRVQAVDELLGRGAYDIIRVDDGTIVTLYHWVHPTDGPEWCLASSNAYDVSALRWAGAQTYAEMFVDLARRAAPEFVQATWLHLAPRRGAARLAFTRPPPAGLCYSIGF
ncbi:MAG TPA: hypothetical protein VNI01_15140, partial [Elusimicrobiota bacterium]|nr:hypothetical protein [Elusimicrobiota bacterium]